MNGTSFDVLDCSLDGINLIEASAGTGKTWNICGLYLRLLLERQFDVRQILVVTFTNAATAELRDRIRSRIVDTLAFLNGAEQVAADPFIERMVAMLEMKPGMDRHGMALQLDHALQAFDEASIFTIHGFCQRALADSAFSSGHAFSLELVPDDAEIVTEVVHDFWRCHIAGNTANAELAGWLIRKKLAPEKLVSILRQAMSRPLSEKIWPDEIDHCSSLDMTQLAAAFGAAHACWREYRDSVVDLLGRAAETRVIHARNYHAESIASAASGFDAFFLGGDPLAPVIKECELLRTGSIGRRTYKGNPPPVHAFFDLADAIFTLREEAERKLELAYLKLIRNLLQENDTIRQRKRERRIVSYNDILYNLYAALENDGNRALADSILQRFPAALIDEFQDTDPMQLSIFRKIYRGTQNQVFFVGDPKQAIYSFRNADLNSYLDVRGLTTASHTLMQNQRSSEGLIDAMNTLFSVNPDAFMLDQLKYVTVEPGSKPRRPFVDRSETRSDLQVWLLPRNDDGTPIERGAAKQAAADATADEIARLLTASKNGEIAIDGRPLQASDIAVLVRSHTQGALIRQALSMRQVGSVELSQQSVFLTSDAEELEQVLSAILTPSREGLLRTALATEIIGCDASRIALSDNGMADYIERFSEYRALWLQRGIGFLFRRLLTGEGVIARMLTRPDGERRLANLFHLGELLHQAVAMHDSPESLLRWLQARRSDENQGEEAQLRLDSDRNLVQIVTIHKSKGLEYPVVFCPFLWDGYRTGRRDGPGYEYHDEQGRAAIDFRLLSDDEAAEIGQRASREEAAETLRLMYVALTRPVYRCYLIAGCYSRRHGKNLSSSESTHSLLNWLVSDAQTGPQEWKDSKRNPDDVERDWHALRERCPAGIGLMPLPPCSGPLVFRQEEEQREFHIATVPASIPANWKIGSFSGLVVGAQSEAAANDHDARFPEMHVQPETDPGEPDPDDILLFPRGPAAGDCLHAAFENVDFVNPSSWDDAITKALLRHPQNTSGLRDMDEVDKKARLTSMILRMMKDVTGTPLPGGILLNQIGLSSRLTELEFYLPSAEIAPEPMNRLLRSLGYDVPCLTFAGLQGYLKGFIDLVFEHGGRYYILDWKSNHLGYSCSDYDEKHVEGAMAEHGYHLQYLLYTVSLNRFLAQRVAGYDYDRHFGGVLYLFVRGVRPEWKTPDGETGGVYFHRPNKSVIERIDSFLREDTAAPPVRPHAEDDR